MTAGVEHLRIGRMRCEAHEVILGLRNPLRDAIGADREEAVVGGEVETIGIARIYGDPVEVGLAGQVRDRGLRNRDRAADRPEEHTSELQSLMRNSYADFCWKKK